MQTPFPIFAPHFHLQPSFITFFPPLCGYILKLSQPNGNTLVIEWVPLITDIASQSSVFYFFFFFPTMY